jgi:erythromycin esterase-like protein
MHKPFIIFISLCLTFLSSKAQNDISNYVKQNTIPISTIEPDSTDYRDLERIGNAIGESRIVMLGEQDHGDAPAFLAKTRLIKYLHEKKGFNVVAFESDFFGLNYGWDNLSKNKNEIDSFLKKNIFALWTLCDGCQDLFYNTIPNSYQTKNPIIMTGFDNQMYLRYSSKNLSQKVDSVLKKLNLPITSKTDYNLNTLSLIDSMSKVSFISKDNSFYDKLLEQLNIIKSEISSRIDSNSYWKILIDNLIATTVQMKFHFSDYYKGSNARDIQMANNLKWLSTYKFPNEKIIVWAHNYHISKFGGNFSEKFLNAANTMGTEFTKDTSLNRKTYIISFTSLQGTSGRLMDNPTKPYKIQKPTKNSIENWFDETLNYGFVDFRKFNDLNPNNSVEFKMKANLLGINRNHSAQWTHIYDGVFYIKKMYPCTLVR